MGARRLAAALYLVSVMLPGCSPGTSGGGASLTPPEPVLNAVLLPGQHITFARLIADRTYEALPSASVILRLTSKWPLNGERVRVTLVPVSPPPQPGPLAWVRSDDLPRKQQLANTGYFEAIVDGFGYSVVVKPAPTLQNSNGFNLVVTTTAGGTPDNPAVESAPIIITIRPRAARTLPSAVFFDCDDSGRGPGNWYNTCKNSGSIVARDVVLQGWLRGPAPNWFGVNNDPIWVEDWHYDFDLDPDFIEQMYGPQGAFLALGDVTLTAATTVLRGNPPGAAASAMQLVDRSAGTGQPLGVTVNSFLQPDNRANVDDPLNSETALKAELNAWHENNQGSPRCVEFFQQCRHWIGRGAPPAGWISLTAAEYAPATVDQDAPANTFWPYDPRVPLVGTSPLVADDYVRVAGTLWQDTDHAGVDRWTRLRPPLGAWLELHPVDWIVRVPGPAVKKLVRIVERINWDPANNSAETRTLEPASRPDASYVLHCRELVDGRFTWPASVVQHSTTVNATNVVAQTTVRRAVQLPGLPGLQPGRFKASYILWWEIGQPETTCRQG
jgi:hypothetical protein